MDRGDWWAMVRKIPWRREWQLTSVFLPGEFHGQRRLVGYKESDTTERVTYIYTPCLNIIICSYFLYNNAQIPYMLFKLFMIIPIGLASLIFHPFPYQMLHSSNVSSFKLIVFIQAYSLHSSLMSSFKLIVSYTGLPVFLSLSLFLFLLLFFGPSPKGICKPGFWPGIKLVPPAVKVQSPTLEHWEFPLALSLIFPLFLLSSLPSSKYSSPG